MLAIFLKFSDFLTLHCYKETNEISLQQIMPALFHFQHTLNRLFNNYKVILILDKFFWKYEWGGQKKLPSKSPALLGLKL